MELSADKRSRESPDSTLKPEGKSLKTSGVATATSAESVVSGACAAVTATTHESNDDFPEPPTIRWKVKEISAAEKKNPSDQSTDTCAAAQESKSKDTDTAEQQQDAAAS